MRGRSFSLPAVLACALMWVSAGCSTSIVSGGELRPGALDDILSRTEAARGIRASGEIDARVVTAEEMAVVVERTIHESWPAADAQRFEATLTALGLWPSEKNLLDEYSRVVGREAAGIYVPQNGVLYVVSNLEIPVSIKIAQAAARRDLMRELLLSHELVHLLQHQAYPDVVGLTTSLRDQDDVAVALQSALEGDATRYSFEALQTGSPPPAPTDMRAKLLEEMNKGDLADTPLVIRYSLIFPYAYGYELSVLEATLLLEDPPVSSEQVLHLDRRRQPFTMFDLGALHDSLPVGCEPLAENTLGEMGISVLFRDLLDRPRARAWQGWDGDRYLGARCEGRLEFLWLTSWDSAADAAEFAEEYAAVAPAVAGRAGHASPPRLERRQRRVLVYTEGLAPIAARVAGAAGDRRIDNLADLLPGPGQELH
ncbi:MAG: hypothetical protein V3R77_07020 [Candidatus Binatia bacterium]